MRLALPADGENGAADRRRLVKVQCRAVGRGRQIAGEFLQNADGRCVAGNDERLGFCFVGQIVVAACRSDDFGDLLDEFDFLFEGLVLPWARFNCYVWADVPSGLDIGLAKINAPF